MLWKFMWNFLYIHLRQCHPDSEFWIQRAHCFNQSRSGMVKNRFRERPCQICSSPCFVSQDIIFANYLWARNRHARASTKLGLEHIWQALLRNLFFTGPDLDRWKQRACWIQNSESGWHWRRYMYKKTSHEFLKH